MSIVFQCKSSRLKNITGMNCSSSALSEADHTGYDGNHADAVWEQYRDVYQAVKAELAGTNPEKENSELKSWKKRDFYLNENPVIISVTKESDTPMDAAIYTILALRSRRLHPVLILSEEKAAVGVWLYSDFDMGESRIRTEEFIYEAYDCGGMLLPVSMNALIDDCDFSQAVMDGCEIVRTYIEALDVNLENGEDILQDFSEAEFDFTSEEESVSEEAEPVCSELVRKLFEECPDITSGKILAEKLSNLILEKETGLDRRSEFRYRRYQDAVRKMKSYNDLLNEKVLGDWKLSDLLEESEKSGDSRLLTDISDAEEEILFSEQSLVLMERYTRAWENCRYKTPDGKVCFDLTKFSKEQIEIYLELLKSGEHLSRVFLHHAAQFGADLGIVCKSSEKADVRAFLSVCMKICSLLTECSGLLETLEETEIPEETISEKKTVDEYKYYIQCKKSVQKAEEWLDMKAFFALSEEEQNEICRMSDEVLKAGLDSVHIPISRDLTESSRKMQERLLERGVYKLEVPLKIQTGKGKNQQMIQICQSLIRTKTHDYNWVHEEYDNLQALFGDHVSENGYCFHIQKKISAIYTRLMTDESISDQTKTVLREVTNCVRTGETGDGSIRSVLSKADSLIYDSYQPFHEKEKEIFQFLELSYVEFDETYKDRMLMDFISDWRKMIESGEVMQECRQAYVALLRNCFSPILKQIADWDDSPEEAFMEFKKLWYQKNMENQIQKMNFDLTDYYMTRNTIDTLYHQMILDCCKLQKNHLLKKFHSFWDGKEEILYAIAEMDSVSDICREYEEVIEESYELLTFSEEKYEMIIKESDEFKSYMS